jgi:hypothetical protein
MLPVMDDEIDLFGPPSVPAGDPASLAAQGATVAEIVRRTGIDAGQVTAALVAAGIAPDSPAHKLRAFDALYQRGVGMTVTSEVMTREGPVSLDKQLPPDPAALAAYLQATMPDRFKAEQAPALVQYVVALPAPSRDGASWLADIGRDAQGRVVATQSGDAQTSGKA